MGAAKRDAKGRYAKGTGGRPRGTKNKISAPIRDLVRATGDVLLSTPDGELEPEQVRAKYRIIAGCYIAEHKAALASEGAAVERFTFEKVIGG